jgi:methylmalonyl-CoA/ethylmalonyl-CoA epimerase
MITLYYRSRGSAESMTPTVGVRRVHHIGIVVDDLDVAIAFVRRVFGLTTPVVRNVPERRRRVAVFEFAGTQLEIAEFEGETSTRIDHIAVEVDDLDAVAEALVVNGVEIAPPGVLEDRGTPSVGRWLFASPETADGISWQFLEPMGL